MEAARPLLFCCCQWRPVKIFPLIIDKALKRFSLARPFPALKRIPSFIEWVHWKVLFQWSQRKRLRWWEKPEHATDMVLLAKNGREILVCHYCCPRCVVGKQRPCPSCLSIICLKYDTPIIKDNKRGITGTTEINPMWIGTCLVISMISWNEWFHATNY